MSLPELHLTPPGRSNATTLLNNHPDDHNLIVDAINDISDFLNDVTGRATYRVYDTVTARNADTDAHIEGMLTWAVSERQMAVWHGQWFILFQPFTAFTPRLFIGTAELRPLGPPPPYQTGYRLSYGVVEFSIGHRFGQIPDSAGTDILYVMPPTNDAGAIIAPPDGQGGFGTAYLVDITGNGAVGGMGGVYNPTQLAIVVPGTGGLLRRSDLGPAGGEIDVFLNGSYTTATYAV